MHESVNLFLIYLPMALDGGLIKEENGCFQWFLSFRSIFIASGLEEPLLAGYR